MKYALMFCGVLALSACAGTAETRATDSLAIACDTYATTLDTLAPLKGAGKLSANNIAIVDKANSYVKPVCGSGSVVDPAQAISLVNQAITLVNTIRGAI